MSPATCQIRTVAVAAVLIAFASAARAQDPHMPPREKEPWTFEAGFYLWLTNMDGEIQSRGLEVDVDRDYSDILDKLDSTYAVRFEAFQWDSFGLAFDTCWINLEDEPEFTTGEGNAEASFGFTEFTAAGRTRSGNAYFDVYGGFRWVRFETSLEDPTGRNEDDSDNYFDPMIGLRVGFTGSTWIHGSLRFDVGGFGVGTERTGNLVIMVDFRVSDSAFLSAGWKTMAVEVEENDLELNLLLTGPVVSVKIGF